MISVIVCTYNRCESLRETLRALDAQVVRDGLTLEVLVVDNNSRDRTRRVVEEAAQESAWPMRYVFESIQGLSQARNRGIRESGGEFLLFTDDDVRPDQQWVQALSDAFVTYGADCVGGKILPLWLQEPPKWLRARPRLCAHLVPVLDRGEAVHRVVHGEEGWVWGANFAFRRSIFERVGPFRTDLGRCGNKLFFGEDGEIVRRIIQHQGTVVYQPTSVVHHVVDPARMRLSYHRRAKFHGGITWQRFGGAPSWDRTHAQAGSWVGRMPRWLIRSCATHGLKALGRYITGQWDAGINEELRFWSELGLIVGGLKPSSTPPIPHWFGRS